MIMPLSSLQLEAFYCLAQTNHFTRAAKRLHITQSALSQRIANLEEELETTLLIRDRAGVQLTEAGLDLLRYCQAKTCLEIELVNKLKPVSSNMLAGQIRLGGFSSVMRSVVMPALSGLANANPEIRLSLFTRETHELPDLLKRGEVDYILLNQILDRGGLMNRVLGYEHNILVEQNGYSGLDVYLDHDENDQTTTQYFKQQGKELTGRKHYLDDIYGIITGVYSGLGRAVVPKHLLKGGDEFKILYPKNVLKIPVVLIFYEQTFYTKLHQAVLKTLVDQCPLLLR